MERRNESFVSEFIMVGLTNQLLLRIPLFVFFLFIYAVALTANISLIIVCVRESRLHAPMYFFLVNLSILDILFSSAIVPSVVVHILQKRWTISFWACGAQMFFQMFLAGAESFLLKIMAYDRYVAICFPLHYSQIMSPSTCTYMVVGCWAGIFLPALLCTHFTLQLPLCGKTDINHFFCEAVTVLKMACLDTTTAELVILIGGIMVVMTPTLIILASYVHIIVAILRIKSSEGRRKAFSTCAAHLIIVIVAYGTANFMYMKPMKKNSANQDKMLSMFYNVGPPVWNPIIYSLRNQEIKTALRKLMMTPALPRGVAAPHATCI